jgi:putative YhdH/YhfP family quinone oxidoreductase
MPDTNRSATRTAEPPANLTSRTWVVDAVAEREVRSSIEERPVEQPAPGQALVRLRWSALNYKDALAATGHAGVAMALPLVPGIDAVGEVVASNDTSLSAGTTVVVAHADFGTRHDGGWRQWAAVPAEWLLPLPDGLTMRQAAILGTAGFTAAQCVMALAAHGVTPAKGPVVVTGATGGVGILAVKLLARLGYHVVAASGKSQRHDWLLKHGARQVISREEIDDRSGRPLLSARWAGGIDTVGGNPLATVLRATRPRGCVAACGLAASSDVPITVFPFILRGVTLVGIDSAGVDRSLRQEIWGRLAGPWRPSDLDDLATVTTLDEVGDNVSKILAGKIAGRVIVDLES